MAVGPHVHLTTASSFPEGGWYWQEATHVPESGGPASPGQTGGLGTQRPSGGSGSVHVTPGTNAGPSVGATASGTAAASTGPLDAPASAPAGASDGSQY